MNTAVVKLQGGLGNQMFQYAFGQAVAAKHNARLLFDLDFFDLPSGDHTPRAFGLDAYGLRCERASAARIALAKQRGNRARTFLHGVHPRLAPDRSYKERSFSFDQAALVQEGDVYFEGYWQSERYFNGVTDPLRKDFTLNITMPKDRSEVAELIDRGQAISVHVRRGDYVTNPYANAHFVTCGAEYYSTAIAKLLARAPAASVFVFCDDIQWARDHIRAEASTHFIAAVGSIHPAIDLHLMSRCHHHVIANSSYSWWGAWLNAKPGKRVIAPARWFNDGAMDTRDLIPVGWEQL